MIRHSLFIFVLAMLMTFSAEARMRSHSVQRGVGAARQQSGVRRPVAGRRKIAQRRNNRGRVIARNGNRNRI